MLEDVKENMNTIQWAMEDIKEEPNRIFRRRTYSIWDEKIHLDELEDHGNDLRWSPQRKIFEEIVAKRFPNLMKIINLQAQEAQKPYT